MKIGGKKRVKEEIKTERTKVDRIPREIFEHTLIKGYGGYVSCVMEVVYPY